MTRQMKIVAVNKDSLTAVLFTTKKAFHTWMKSNDLEYTTWKREGKKESTQFEIRKGNDDGEYSTWDVQWDVRINSTD